MKRMTLGLIVLLALPSNLSFGFEALPIGGVGMLMQSGHDSKLGYDIGIDVKIADAGKGWQIRNITSGFHADWEKGAELEVVRNMTITQKSIWYKMQDSVMVWDFHLGLGSGVWNFLNNSGENETSQAYELEVGGLYKGVTIDLGINAIRRTGPDMYYTYFGIGLIF